MSNDVTDAELVAGHLAGDSSALAGIYDRYADSLHDTAAAMLRDRHDAADVMQDVILVAAQKLDQLRDPTRLKPWLFAILRNEVYRRTKQRKRTVATDFGSEFDVVDERGLDADAEAASGTELAELVRGAAGGLDERDQLVLELSVRQGLEGQDLADALGVSANQSYTLVHRMRERIERSLGAFAVASTGRDDCDDLAALLQQWDGEFTVLVRKRVARHIERCDVCTDRRRKIAPLALFGAAPVLAAPAELRDRILATAQHAGSSVGNATSTASYGFTASGGFPGPVRVARRVAAWIAPTIAAGLIVLLAGSALLLLGDDDGAVRTATLDVPGLAVSGTTAPSAPSATSAVTVPATVTATTGLPSTSTTSTTAPSTSTTTNSTIDVVAPPPPSTTTATSTTSAPPPITAPPPTAPPPTAPPQTAPPATQPPTTTTQPPAPGQLAGSSGLVDLGGSSPTAGFTLSNPGGLPVNWTLGGSPAPFTVSPASGTLGPGTSVTITIGFDRAGLPEGDTRTAQVSFDGNGGQNVALTITGGVERPPEFRNPRMSNPFCSTLMEFIVTSSIVDDSLPLDVTVTVVGPNGQSGDGAMFPSDRAGGHSGMVAIVNTSGDLSDVIGTWTFSISATDTRGNSRNASGSLDVTC